MSAQEKRWRLADRVRLLGSTATYYFRGLANRLQEQTHKVTWQIGAAISSATGAVSGVIAGCGCTGSDPWHSADPCSCDCHRWHHEDDERRLREAYEAELATPYECRRAECGWRGTWRDCGHGDGYGGGYTMCPNCGEDDTCYASNPKGRKS